MEKRISLTYLRRLSSNANDVLSRTTVANTPVNTYLFFKNSACFFKKGSPMPLSKPGHLVFPFKQELYPCVELSAFKNLLSEDSEALVLTDEPVLLNNSSLNAKSFKEIAEKQTMDLTRVLTLSFVSENRVQLFFTNSEYQKLLVFVNELLVEGFITSVES